MFSANPCRTDPGQPGDAPSVIRGDMAVKGELQSAGGIRIEGRIDGWVRCAALVVGESGVILGGIEAETVTVHGRVEGSIRARTLVLAATARVAGDIAHRTLVVRTGALIHARLRHAADPLAEVPPSPGGLQSLRAAE
ncbi:MAG TPA: polymer-forming cytoskeletal protein [Rhizomicrobium sp.]|jgi:cytoskeletal protein CcmA (bactofilin family)|nr:polymer-forming cytoskeletal protein [Rhizomicrobium sp.]